jgi:N6-adenosine-specific RNA methylase IME4
MFRPIQRGYSLTTRDNKRYRTLHIDFPIEQTKTNNRSVRPNQGKLLDYPTWTLDQIKAFPINDYADEQCHIYLWSPEKYTEFYHELIKQWKEYGFKKHTTIYWYKRTGVTPYTFQFVVEPCYFLYRGKLDFPKQYMGIPNYIDETPKRPHSRKPDKIYDVMDKVSASPKLDLFGRIERLGYDVIGDEVGKVIEIPLITLQKEGREE